ncbi:MAG: TRAP transporter small permease subunit [Burkholderiales bacterium]|nr:TRAP transporter small permease subunit [Burkholderiales bacterium]
MQGLIRAIERASTAVGIFGACLIVPLVLATCYEVFARYAFGAPTIWAYEVGYTLTGAHFLLAMAFTLKAGEHIRIDIFSGAFSARMRAGIDLAGYAIVLPLLAWITWYLMRHFALGWTSNEKSGQSAFNMPVWPFRLVFVAAFVMLTLQVAAEVLKTLRTLAGAKGAAS